MAKDKQQMDNVFLLVGRQSKVESKLFGMINSPTGMNRDEWATLTTIDLPLTIMVSSSPQLRDAIDQLNFNGGYTVSSNLAQLYRLIRVDFERSKIEYIRRGLLTLEPDAQMVQSTMNDPIPAEKVMGPLLEEEDNE
jgi:hypothetical protein